MDRERLLSEIEEFLQERAQEVESRLVQQAAVLRPVQEKLDQILEKLDWMSTSLVALERKVEKQ
jgi:hypothetical protein